MGLKANMISKVMGKEKTEKVHDFLTAGPETGHPYKQDGSS